MLSSKHSLDELSELVNTIKQYQENIFSRPHFIVILPDNLTINNAREKIIEFSSPAELTKIHLTTIEDFASGIIRTTIERNARLLSSEARKAILTNVIRKIVSNKNDNLAQKIWNVINTESPETHEVLNELYNEFEEFTGCINAPPYNEESHKYLEELIKTANKLPDDYSKDNLIDTLRLYEKLLLGIEEEMKILSINDYFTRTHLVKEATNQITNNKDKLLKKLDDKTQIWVIGISVFNTSAFQFLIELANTFGYIRINAGKMTLERLEKRAKSIKNITLNFENINTQTSLDLNHYKMIELPDIRREIDAVAIQASELIKKDIKPQDIVVISRDSGSYLPYVEKILKDYGLASHVQTRRSLALTPAYRLVSSLLELLTMVERNEPIPARAITDPIRLGFRKYNTRWNKTIKPALTDKRFLWIESQAGFICQGKDLKWDEWKQKLSGKADSGILEVVDWIDENKDKPDTKPIREIIQPLEYVIEDFARSCVCWASPLNLTNGFPYDRFELCNPHITSQAGWLHSLVERLNEYSDLYTRIRGEEKHKKWEDIKYGFYAIAGTETYGIQLKDACAIRFVDAGISHFIDGKVRFILGLKSEGFPRKCPKPFLLKNEFRRLINEQFSIFYLRDPITDYENEMDFFITAVGPRPNQEQLVLTMPYLDDRGHREEWSTFVKKNESIDRIAVSNIFNYKESTIAPTVYWKSIVLTMDGEGSLADHFNSQSGKIWDKVSQNELSPRLSAIESRIINRNGKIKLDNGEKYLNEFISHVKNDPIPAHELDLFNICPMMYYFYRFLYCLGPYDRGDKKGDRTYIPEWKSDFLLGPIPFPVRRHFISSEMQEALGEIIIKYPSVEKLRMNKNSIITMINTNRKLEYYGKRRLNDIIQFIIDEANPDSYVTFKPAGLTSEDKEIYRPGYIAYIGKVSKNSLKSKKLLIFFAKTGPRTDSEVSILRNFYGKKVESPGAKKWYQKLDDDDYEQLKEDFRSMVYTLKGRDTGACSTCVYATLCGEWGFM